MTPSGDSKHPILERSVASTEEKFVQVLIKPYQRLVQCSLQRVLFGSLEATEPSCMAVARPMDVLWLSNSGILRDLPQCQSWSGFMQLAMESDNYDKSRIESLPFINQNPSDLGTIYST